MPKTPTGRYTLRHLRLDRPALRRRRARLHEDQRKAAQIEGELAAAGLPPQHRQALAEYLADVRARLSPPVFRDQAPLNLT